MKVLVPEAEQRRRERGLSKQLQACRRQPPALPRRRALERAKQPRQPEPPRQLAPALQWRPLRPRCPPRSYGHRWRARSDTSCRSCAECDRQSAAPRACLESANALCTMGNRWKPARADLRLASSMKSGSRGLRTACARWHEHAIRVPQRNWCNTDVEPVCGMRGGVGRQTHLQIGSVAGLKA